MSHYPDHRPLFPLDLATLKPGLSQLVADPSTDSYYLMGKERGGGVLLRYDVEAGFATPIIASKGMGNSIGYGGLCYDALGGKVVMAMSEGHIGMLSEDGQNIKALTPSYKAVAAPRVCQVGEKAVSAVQVLYVAGLGERQQVMYTDGESQPVPLSDPAWFVFDPVLSADGRWLAWQQWQSHQMPFISSTIEVAEVTWQEGRPSAQHRHSFGFTTAKGEQASAAYPQFSPDSRFLGFCSDHQGRRQIYLQPLAGLSSESPQVIPITEGEVGDPSWVYGQQPFRFLATGQIVWRHSIGLSDRLMLTANDDLTSQVVYDDGTALSDLAVTATGFAVIAERSNSEPQLLVGDASGARAALTSKRGGYSRDILQQADRLPLTFAGGHKSEGLFTPPRMGSGSKEGMGKHPLVVSIHGGPTARTNERFRAEWQYLASRGLAILDINHRGSGGHGREFQDLLAGNWGVVDAEDAKAAAEQALAAYDYLDPERVFIMGGSAGGYTTLRALCVDSGFWAGGICSYGIADLIKLEDTTHPFERPYNPYLLGQDDGQSWRERSPAFHEPLISTPVLIFHGKLDKAVPIGPMEDFHAALLAAGNRDARLVVFDDEGHGFRRAENIRTVLTETLAFVGLS